MPLYVLLIPGVGGIAMIAPLLHGLGLSRRQALSRDDVRAGLAAVFARLRSDGKSGSGSL